MRDEDDVQTNKEDELMESEQEQQPTRKYYLTTEQQRVVDTMREYEKAYITRIKQGNFLVLNGDPTERIKSATINALIKKGYLQWFTNGKIKLIEE